MHSVEKTETAALPCAAGEESPGLIEASRWKRAPSPTDTSVSRKWHPPTAEACATGSSQNRFGGRKSTPVSPGRSDRPEGRLRLIVGRSVGRRARRLGETFGAGSPWVSPATPADCLFFVSD